MPFDLYVNTDGQLEYDNFGDFQTTSGNEHVRQQIRLALQRGLGQITVEQLTQQRKRNIRRNVRDALESCPYVDRIVSIQLRTPSDDRLDVDVRTQSEDLNFQFDR